MVRTAIEAHLLGARTVVIERRPKFTRLVFSFFKSLTILIIRNNVLKLWKFVVADLKMLGAKYFYGKLCVGNINHVNIRTLQLILTKICLVLGVIINNSYMETSQELRNCPRVSELKKMSFLSGWKVREVCQDGRSVSNNNNKTTKTKE